MKRTHIATLPVEEDAPADKRRVRIQAPKYIQSVIEETRAIPEFKSLDEVRSEFLKPLSGGVNAATYLLQSPKLQAILKFNYKGVEAEAEALRVWRDRQAHVPKVYAHGVVPVTKHMKQPIKFLLQQALLDTHNRVVETCDNFLVHTPNKAREIGRLMGVELKKMHSCVAKRHFGDFADSVGSLSTYSSWNTFMQDYLKSRAPYLQSIDITSEQLTTISAFIDHCRFVKRGRYIHGDFSIRNAAVKSYDPLQIYLFDPNPIIGDPTWDIANFYNNHEYKKRRVKYDKTIHDLYVRDRQLLTGFRQGYARRIPQEALMASRLIQASLQAEFQEAQLKQGEGEKIAVQVRKEFIYDLIIQIERHVKRAGRN